MRAARIAKMMMTLTCLTACEAIREAEPSEDLHPVENLQSASVERDWLVIADIYRQLDGKQVQAEKQFLRNRLKAQSEDKESRLRLGILLALHGKNLAELSESRRLLKETEKYKDTPGAVKRIVSLMLTQSQRSIQLWKRLLESEANEKELAQKLQAVSTIEQKLEERTRE